MLQGAANAEEELILLKGLEDVIVGAAADGLESGGDVVNGGDHDDGNVGLGFANPFEELEAIHLGHDHVAKNEIGGEAEHLLLGKAAIADDAAGKSLGLQQGGHDFANRLFVVDDQDFFGFQAWYPPAVIIREVTEFVGRPCPVGK